MKRMIFIALSVALVSGSAFAGKKYNAQGCGLGSYRDWETSKETSV